MNGTAPAGPQQTPSSRSSALLWTVAVVGVLGGLGLYLTRGERPAAEPATEPAAAPVAVAAAPDPKPTPPPPPDYFTTPPCRLFDGSVAAGESMLVLSADCGLPASARTLAVTVSLPNPAAAGTLELGAVDPVGAVTLDFEAARPRNGSVYLPLPADGSGRVAVRNTSGAPVRVLLDLSGYFE